MKLTHFTDPKQFQDTITPVLGKNEILHNLIIGISARLVDLPDVHTDPAYMAVVTDADELCLAALMTPPRDLIFAAVDEPQEEQVRLIVTDLVKNNWLVPGVNGALASAELFARTWEDTTGQTSHLEMAMRLFDLREVIQPRPATGKLRLAEMRDLDLMIDWLMNFEAEAIPDSKARTSIVRKLTAHRIEEGDVFLWTDIEPVSMSVVVRKTARGAVVGGVYTPPELRGRGYASSCVAGLSQAQLDKGKQYCALFTDLANPTSNHIYQAIGYKPICDFKHYVFKDLQS